jgi:hypothetical protein
MEVGSKVGSKLKSQMTIWSNVPRLEMEGKQNQKRVGSKVSVGE